MDAKGPLWADIERIQVGDTAFVEARISEEDVDTFATLSGDQNPLHHDTELVHRLGHSRRIAHGALSIGLVSRLIGMNLPGPGSLWRKVTAEFVAPVLAGDTVRATVTVTRVSRGVGVVALDTKIERIPNTLVMRGTAEVMIVQEPAESPVIAPGKPCR